MWNIAPLWVGMAICITTYTLASSLIEGMNAIPQSSVAPTFLSIYRYAWFVGFALAFIFYLLLRGITGSRRPANDVIVSEAKRSRRNPSKRP